MYTPFHISVCTGSVVGKLAEWYNPEVMKKSCVYRSLFGCV